MAQLLAQGCNDDLLPMVGFFPWRHTGTWYIQWRAQNIAGFGAECEQVRLDEVGDDLFLQTFYQQLRIAGEYITVPASLDAFYYSYDKNNWGQGFEEVDFPKEFYSFKVVDTDFKEWALMQQEEIIAI